MLSPSMNKFWKGLTHMSDLTPPPADEPDATPTPAPLPTAPPVVAMPVAPQNGAGTAALIFGIVQFFCIPFIGGILAIVFGRIGVKKAKAGLATNGTMATVGFWLGIVGLILSIIGVIITVFVVIWGVNTINTNTDAKVNSETGLADGEYQMDPDAHFALNDRCGFTGDPYDSTMKIVKEGVTVSGSGVTECGASSSDVTVVRFDVVDGVAKILQVQ